MVEMDREVGKKKKNIKVYRQTAVPTPPGVIKDGYLQGSAALRDVIKHTLNEKQMKTKDVAIRKSFGCSRRKVFYDTVLGFIWPVGAAALLAIPAAWYFIRHWLSKYPVRIENSLWIYISALAIVLIVVTSSMATQAARLMRTNPADVLKKE